jgi:putative ABC transport system permease protein
VTFAGVTSQLPLHGETWIDALADADSMATRDRFDWLGPEVPPANFRFASPGYWKAMGITLKQGRFLEEADRGRAVALIGERAARRLWPNDNALGKRIRRGGPDRPVMEVVGVVADVRTGLEKEPPLMVYEPYWAVGPGGPSFVLRTAMDPVSAAGQVRRAITSLDRELPIPQPRTMRQIVSESVAARRFQTSIAAAFAVSALLLTALGIYGVISFSVVRRTPELGIRMAIGAQANDVAAMVLRQGMIPVAGGLVIGMACALAVTRLIKSQLYGVTPQDPWIFGAVVLVLATAGALACWIPARRAARINPLRALRFE